MNTPTAAMLTIGDEILSGRTRDANLPHLAEALVARGIQLCEARVVPDVAAEIIAALNALRARYDHVFTSGGIGPTHDDITADAVAAAFGVPIDIRADARAVLALNYANPEVDLNPARLRMARIPEGGILIENPVSRAPGFTLGNVHVMAGVPDVFRAMVAGLLPRLTGVRRCCRRRCAPIIPKGCSPVRWVRSPLLIRLCRSAATRSTGAGITGPIWWRGGRTGTSSTLLPQPCAPCWSASARRGETGGPLGKIQTIEAAGPARIAGWPGAR